MVADAGQTVLFDKIKASLYGGAIGDALGAPAEWKLPPQIQERYGTITDFVEGWDGPSDIGKGDGRYTDDSHMIQVLSRMYVEAGTHLDSFSFAKRVIPLIAEEKRWVAEYGREMLLMERLFYPEKWLYMRLALANADPRQGGVGNMVNCGAAMYAAPVGIVNAGDPLGAYREAADIFLAHQQSYGLEAAAVFAAAVAEALRPGATPDSVVDVALSLAKEGTHKAIAAVTERARQYTDWKEAIVPLREVMKPYDGSAELNTMRGNGTNNWQPSREHSIEEVPVALGFLLVTKGDFESGIFGGANYGRDNDSIASMVGTLSGALNGTRVIRPNWMAQINSANRVDLVPLAEKLTELTLRLQQEQLQQAQARAAAFQQLSTAL